MAIKRDPVTLRSRYTEQAVADLEENRRRQAELLSHLEVLQEEEVLLLDIINLTGSAATASPSTPAPSQRESMGPPASGPDAPASQEASPETPPGEPDVPRKAGERRGAGQQPLLKEILLELLSAHSEPRAAREVWQECLQKHPDRSPSNQVVRNSLEGLVARGVVARHKQKHTVMYSFAQKG
ncbi:hypothetical protein [Streptomyces sp. NPDC046870]|uniref:hypothetical protein n=1 Tax=Streptomyces sp. NPDC046870 TaxID=3155135 RepID=UPI0034559D59